MTFYNDKIITNGHMLIKLLRFTKILLIRGEDSSNTVKSRFVSDDILANVQKHDLDKLVSARQSAGEFDTGFAQRIFALMQRDIRRQTRYVKNFKLN